MAETALSLARSILGSAISKATSAAAEEMSLLMGVQKEIWFMKDELKTMQAFLVTAEAMKRKKPLLKVWAEQVRSLSYDIEDCLDEFMVHVGSRSLSRQLMKLRDHHRIAVQIRNLKSRVEEVSNRNTRYNLIQTEGTNLEEEHSSTMEDIRNNSANNIDEAQLVGFDTPKQELLEMINTQDNNDGHAQVICVVGMGGMGKTTLVRKIYESKEGIVKNFSCHAWITVSQSFSMIEILKDMIVKFLGDDSLKRRLKELEGKGVQTEDLASYLREELKEKRYFIVLDDLWKIEDWKWIREVSLPISNNITSQIIVTTRNIDLAKMCTTDSLIYHLEPLKEEDATRLLLKKIKKKSEDLENDDKLKILVKQLVKKCGRLPLAIITIGALFATKHESKWDKLYKQLPSELENNLNLEAIKSMVILSYSHLPSHLKPCFLYLSIFPEDFKIARNRLVNRWIAEGLVKDRVGMTLEEVGDSYFKDLINRSMVQPCGMTFEGTIESCRVHDIMRDIIVSLSRDEGFAYTYGDNIIGPAEDKYRHVAYHVSKCSTKTIDWGHVRSLTIFGERPAEHSRLLHSAELRMIRIVDLENAEFRVTQKDIRNIGFFRHLKYLSIGASSIYAIPNSIGKLHGLQVLDLSHSYITALPSGISKLQNLRILLCYKRGYYNFFEPDEKIKCLRNSTLLLRQCNFRNDLIGELHMAYSSCWSNTTAVKVPRGIGNLKELQVLEYVDIKGTSSKAIEELGELSKLRILSVSTDGATEKKCVTFCKAIQKLSSLSTLKIHASFNGTVDWLDSGFFLPPKLRNLKLWGQVGHKVDWFRKLTQLVNLDLNWSTLEEGKVVEILGALPELMHLGLYFKSYSGMKLVFVRGVFLKLRKLLIGGLRRLREIRFEQDTLPEMEIIEISTCSLQLGINGIKHLPKLKEISLGPLSNVASLCMLQDEVNRHPNHPVLRLCYDQSGYDLGDPEGSDEYFDARQSFADHAGEGSEEITAAENNSQANPVSN